MPRPIVIGNWKQHGLRADLDEVGNLIRHLDAAVGQDICEIALCPPATLIAQMTAYLRVQSPKTGGQTCSIHDGGAYTGEVSAAMLKDAGATFCIVGHSERRHLMGESDDDVKARAEACVRAGLIPVVCVGESEEVRDAGGADDFVAGQLLASLPDEVMAADLIVAYEPCWAIGTGRTPSLADIEAMHRTIRETLKEPFDVSVDRVRILYGGSVKPSNAADILALEGVDGALVGGASLKADDFFAIIQAASGGP